MNSQEQMQISRNEIASTLFCAWFERDVEGDDVIFRITRP